MVKQLSAFDCVVHLWGIAAEFEAKDLLGGAGGFLWDRTFFPTEYTSNNSAPVLPFRFSPDLSAVPNEYFQSGVGGLSDLELLGLKDVSTYAFPRWIPLVQYGTYFIHKDRDFLHSHDSTLLKLGSDQNSAGRSVLNLKIMPRAGLPVNVYVLTRDEDFSISQTIVFDKVQKFTGKVVNGRRQDSSLDSQNIDTDKNEYILTRNASYLVENYQLFLSLTVNNPRIYRVILTDPPYSFIEPTFSRNDIFQNRLSYGDWIDPNVPKLSGDYFVGFIDSGGPIGVIEVLTSYDYSDFGVLLYAQDYPASIEFNANYITSVGTELIGTSDGEADQSFSIEFFPVLDETTPTVLDSSMILIGYESDGTPTVWTRIRDLSGSGPADPVYELDSEMGIVTFGDGVTGAVPAARTQFYLDYQYVPWIEYDSIQSSNYFVDNNINLDPTALQIGRGFLYLTNVELEAAKIKLTTQFANKAGPMYGPVYPSLDLIPLTATVTSKFDEPVPSASVTFKSSKSIGIFDVEEGLTDSLGKLETTYMPIQGLDNLGFKVNFYEPHTDNEGYTTATNPNLPAVLLDPDTSSPEADWVISTYQANDTLVLSEKLTAVTADNLGDVYLFSVYNNDPLRVFNTEELIGGRKVLVSETGTYEPLKPIEIIQESTYTKLVFGQSLATPNTIPAYSGLGQVDWTLTPENYLVTSNVDPGFIPTTGHIGKTLTIAYEGEEASGDYFIKDIFSIDTYANIDDPLPSGTIVGFILDRDIPEFPALNYSIYEEDYHLVQYIVSAPILLNFHAELETRNVIVDSNILDFYINLPLQYVGTFTLNPGGAGAVLDGTTWLKLRAMTITDISPSEVNVAGGELVTITGENFATGDLILYFGPYKVETYTIIDEHTITAIAPAGSTTDWNGAVEKEYSVSLLGIGSKIVLDQNSTITYKV